MNENDCRLFYADLVETFAEKGATGVESKILSLGRTDMHVLCAYLFVRALTADLDEHRSL